MLYINLKISNSNYFLKITLELHWNSNWHRIKYLTVWESGHFHEVTLSHSEVSCDFS